MFAATEVVCVLCVCIDKNWPQHLEVVENGDWGTIMACLDSNCASLKLFCFLKKQQHLKVF